MRYDHVDGGQTEYRTNLNHETGHVFGLCDPNPAACDLGSWPICTSASVMHQYQYYGCYGYTVVNPQADDLANVSAQISSFP